MKVDLIQYMGSDVTVCNAARVSFDKTSDGYDYDPHEEVWVVNEKDQRLIQYLAKHGHWTPFGHVTATFRIKAPIFVARQLGKHQVGLVWNEVSRRYVDSDPEFYVPDSWRKRAENVKQGSGEALKDNGHLNAAYAMIVGRALGNYQSLLDQGVCPEQARIVLPQSMMTEWYWTGSLAAWARVCKLRLDSHTQRETREVATMIARELETLWPYSWKALMDGKHDQA